MKTYLHKPSFSPCQDRHPPVRLAIEVIRRAVGVGVGVDVVVAGVGAAGANHLGAVLQGRQQRWGETGEGVLLYGIMQFRSVCRVPFSVR